MAGVGGKPPFVPTPEQRMRVQIMTACGMNQTMIAEQTINPRTGAPVDLKTLRKVFRAELDEGSQSANALVAQALFKKATGTGPQSVTAAIFWMKARAGWKDKTHVEINGNVGDKPNATPADLSQAELEEQLRIYGVDPQNI